MCLQLFWVVLLVDVKGQRMKARARKSQHRGVLLAECNQWFQRTCVFPGQVLAAEAQEDCVERGRLGPGVGVAACRRAALWL